MAGERAQKMGRMPRLLFARRQSSLAEAGEGKPGIAQGGGTDAARIEEALERGVEMVRERME